MSDELFTTLLPALQIAPFERRPDGSFVAMTAPPSWFARLADVTFPFLGHILEEANSFWRSGLVGSREWGPCADEDEKGREFHYKVLAVTASGRHFLVFQLDQAADRMREVLQQVRERALATEPHPGADPGLAILRLHVAAATDAIQEIARRLLTAEPTEAQRELLNMLAARCADLRTATHR
ncbi:MAG TPA: hypothetical protein VH458_09915 [Vicinamibacterales bacterium]|jgi:hypothetical protein